MGEVYRARDLRLDREVAVKILPDAFAGDADRIARFQREAKTLASLNHPNIAIIHGLEQADGVHALVMELVAGEDLAERIARGPIPFDEALPIAKQIADALEAAHEQGIVHRDLKPANIKIRPDGAVKVLDFGLAKAMDAASGAGVGHQLTHSPTITSPMTQMGVILGTAAYMAPEQARGKPVDKRADIWAFGCVLYEMVTATQTFPGSESESEAVAAILKNEPAWTLLPPATPLQIRRLLRRCLEKDPRRRLRDIGEARVAIEETNDGSSFGNLDSAPPGRQKSRRWFWPIAAAATAALAAFSIGIAVRPRPLPTERVVRASIPAPPGARFHLAGGNPGPVIVSPDGSKLAFTASENGAVRIWVRDLDSTAAHVLIGTDDAQYPFWSPDSRWVGFFAKGSLKKVEVAGGVPVKLADASDGKGGAWNESGVILFTPDAGEPLYRVAASGGSAVKVTALAAGENSHRFPDFLPDGRHFLFLVRGDAVTGVSAGRGGSIRVGSIDDPTTRVLTPTDSHAIFASGYVLYVQAGSSILTARPIDLKALNWSGDPVPVADDVMILSGSMRGVFSASHDGVLCYLTGSGNVNDLVWLDRAGTRHETVGQLSDFHFRLSPDGTRLVFADVGRGAAEDIFALDLARKTRTRVTSDLGADISPVWSPDSGSIVFASSRRGHIDLYWKSLTGGGEEPLLFASNDDKRPTSWSHDARTIAFQVGPPSAAAGLWVLPLTGSTPPTPGTPVRLDVASTELENDAAFSPDSRWLAYTANDSGTGEIYVADFPKIGRKWRVSAGGGSFPRWRGDGRELFYVGTSGQLMVVTVTPNAAGVEIGPPARLFEASLSNDATAPFDVSQDGQRFLVRTTSAEGANMMLTLDTNWTRRLKPNPQ